MSSKILIVDDSNVAAQSLKNVIESENHETFILNDGRNIVSVANDKAIDVILLDIVMPEISGYEVLEILKSTESTKYIPVIVITGLTYASEVKRAMDYGAMDFIRKTSEPVEILARVNSAIKIKNQHDQLVWSARRDPMTQLYNKQFFNTTLDALIKEKNHHRKGIGLLLIDCDFFKKINDNHGHTYGDSVIITLASKIAESVRETDFACRFGGEEFCVILVNVSPYQSYTIAEKIRVAVEATTEVDMTVSIGISHSDSGDKKQSVQMVNEADLALHEAKEKGRNRTVIFDK